LTTFHAELRREVAAYFATRSAHDAPKLYVKAFAMLAWFAASWWALVFVADSAPVAIVLAVSTGLALAGAGMGFQHDAVHGSLSRHRVVNRAFSVTFDAMGASSHVWRTKHNVIHHAHTNIAGADDDLDAGPLARFSAAQRRRRAHRWQHLYMWPLYGFLHIKWAFVDDFVNLAQSRVGTRRLPRPRSSDWIQLVAGKAIYIGFAVVIPLALHPVGHVVALYAIAAATAGITLAITFQLAHCVEEADFPTTLSGDGFAAHQLATTVDFARDNRALTWFVGGLNFQVEHHLFPQVSHVHYPALSAIVERVSRRHGIRYRAQPTLRGAIASHFRHLRRLGAA
jgi:linoleoyl-CoA desaturase